MFRAVFWVILPCKMIVDQYNPEDSSEHHTRRRENLQSDIMSLIIVFGVLQSLLNLTLGSAHLSIKLFKCADALTIRLLCCSYALAHYRP
jgi:uncharacterized membrane protein